MEQDSETMSGSLFTDRKWKEGSHTQYSGLEDSVIYPEYCLASKVDNRYFVEYILSLKT